MNGRKNTAGKVEDFFCVSDQAAKNLAFPFFQTLPFQLGNLFHELLHLLVVVDGLANAWVPSLGDTDLAQFPLVALDQIQGGMELALGTTAGRFAALAATWV